MDKSRKHLDATECFYLLNNERVLNQDGSKKGTIGSTTPMVANYPACEMDQPEGDNPVVGKYYSALTNELYSWVYNSNGVHYIQRINGDGECEVVYAGDCPIPLKANPENEITQFRAYLQLDKICSNRHGKSLIWVNGDSTVGQIDTEASIATDYFSTPFFERCADGCEFIQMCVPDPCGCLVGEFVPLSESDKGKKNNLLDVGIQISYRHIYYDGRASIWADPSTLFYQSTKSCFDNSEGFPRCLKIRVPIGNPLVDKIEIAYSKNGVWYSAEVVDKYKKYNNSQQFWYERELAELTNYSDSDCSFDYFFCNDKQCEALDPKEFSRVFNPMPMKPQAILPIGIGEDRTALGFVNYEQGFCPIDKTEAEKIDIGISFNDESCESKYTTIKIRAVIHNYERDRNQPIFRLGGDTSQDKDDPTDVAFFGGLNANGSGDLELTYGQQFRDKTRNFIVYIEGTDYWAEMKQWKAKKGFVGLEEWGVLSGLDSAQTKRKWRNAIKGGEFFYQEAEIKVLRGTRGFLRLSSHEATGNEQDKSTFVVGIINDIRGYRGDIGDVDLSAISDYTTEEIYFDSCGKETIDVYNGFIIKDNAIDAGSTIKSAAYHGYVTDKSGRPVEGAVIEISGGSSITDHNGFYHLYRYPGDSNDFPCNVKVEQDCFNFTVISNDNISGDAGDNTRNDVSIDDDAYDTGFYANVKMLVQDCDGSPVSGVRVALSGSKYDVTNSAGYAIFRVRNYNTRDRIVRAVVMNNNGCFSTDCNGVCNPCMDTRVSNTFPCYLSKPTIILQTATINKSYSLITSKGLKSGGRYPFGFYVRFDCGQISAVNEIKYIDIPKIQERVKEGFASFYFNGNGIVLPHGAKCLNIVRGENINPFELQWVIDKVERGDGKIKLTIQSLNDYNEKYFSKLTRFISGRKEIE